MRSKSLFFCVLFVVCLLGCTSGDRNVEGVDRSNLDTTVLPGVDFYQYATGGWQKANPIPDEYARYATFDQLGEKTIKQMQELIEELRTSSHKPGSVSQKIGDLYRIGMDSVRLNNDGVKPMKPLLDEIQGLKTRKDLAEFFGANRAIGLNPFFYFGIGPDDKNSTMNIMHLYQGGLGLGERDYYLLEDKESKAIREGYLKLIQAQFVNAGFSAQEGKKASLSVLSLETALAKAHYNKERTRIPEENYHKFSLAELDDKTGSFDWKLHFKEMGIEGLDSLNVGQPEAIVEAVNLFETRPIEEIKAYFLWCAINGNSNLLSDDFLTTDFEFYGRQLSGTTALQPRWKRVVGLVEGCLGEAVGQMYVEKYFPASSKKRMLKLVNNLKVSLQERIDGLQWMSDTTKAKAREKLATITVKIGYPDTWRDYSKLSIEDDSYFANIHRAMRFDYAYNLDKLGKPVDKSEWLMFPQTVNAYYNPSTNEICFPAGILQPPFFFAKGDDAVNYGAIGVVIGHEMSHGYDDQGRMYDKEGNMVEWWTSADADRFNKRTQVLVDHFNTIKVLGELRANGTYTLGENIADNGGLQIAYHAFLKTREGKSNKPIDGFTPGQRFFLAYATVWADNIRDEEIIRRTNLDVHSLGKWRVNGALPHIDAWYEAFGIKSTDPLYIQPEKRASIW